MKITIESTPELAQVNGLPVRIWTGQTERGTPLLAFITRIGVPDGVNADELASELNEPPTRVIEPIGDPIDGPIGFTGYIAAPRSCTVCMQRNIRRPATHVARDADGMEWFECGGHGPEENETHRVSLEQIGAWFDRAMLPMPPGQREALEAWVNRSEAAPVPHGVVSAIVGDDRASDGAFVLNAMRGAQVAWAQIAALAPSDERARTSWLAGFRLAAGPDGAPKEPHDPSWIVKDFHALYLAASDSLNRTRADATAWLELQLARLRPAFEFCESEREGAPHRLTVAERYALTGLHRWLHSPTGDWDLVEAAELYHTQVAAQNPHDCERLQAEEQAEHTDPGVSVPDDDEVARVVRGVLAELPERHEKGRPDLHRIISAALAHNEREPVPVECVHRCHATPALPGRVVRALIEHPRVSGAGVDFAGATIFLAHAMRGAAVGWHARHAHPDEVPVIARAGAPLDEPPRSAWITGYRIAVDGLDGVPALTDALRARVRDDLRYRSPETLTAHERALIAAVEAEENMRAESPETWLGGDR